MIPLINRIQYDSGTGCWNFLGLRNNCGYGVSCHKGKKIYAHRLAAHLWLNFQLNDKRLVLHRCDNPACFNPKHLYLGSQKDNMRDRKDRGRDARSHRTHCKHGHPLVDENCYVIISSSGYLRKECRKCRKLGSKVLTLKRRIGP